MLGTALRGFWPPTVVGALPGLLLFVLALALASGWGLALALVAAVLVLVVGAALGLLLGIFRTATRALPGNYFGLCTGMAEPESVQPQPLTIWLGELLERLAGRQPGGRPLTFGDLWRGDEPDATEDSIRLEMMTTNLTNRRPHRLPWDERVFYFRPSELLDLFPGPRRPVDGGASPLLRRSKKPDAGSPSFAPDSSTSLPGRPPRTFPSSSPRA